MVPGSKKEWLEKRSKGVRETVAGGILLGVALLAFIGFFVGALAADEPGVLIMWVPTCSWMAVWGVIRLVKGIPDMIESKMMLREMEPIAGGRVAASTTVLRPEAGQLPMAPGVSAAADQAPPLSVTEHTTETLGEHRAPHPGMVTPERQK
jgi:hypothetical protein